MKCFLHYELITYVKPIANPMDGCFLDVVDMTKLAFTQGGDGLAKPTTPNAAIEVFCGHCQRVNEENFVFLAMQKTAHNTSEILLHQVLFSASLLLF